MERDYAAHRATRQDVSPEASYVEFMRKADDERNARLAQLGQAFLASLDRWDGACAAGHITTPEERIRVMHDTITMARFLGLLPAQPSKERK